MKRALIVGAIAVLSMYGAHAADLPPRAPGVYAPAVYAPAFTWSGVYAGANGGYGWGEFGNTAGSLTRDFSGGFAGGQIGGNWQSGMFVLGGEADLQASWQKRTVNGTIGGIAFGVTQEIPWFGTVRARAGIAVDRHLFYVTGGAAWVNAKVSATALGATLSSNDTTTAWTFGGGWEWMIVDRWSAKVEYLYIDTGNTTLTLFGAPVTGKGHDNIVRLGLNYHF